MYKGFWRERGKAGFGLLLGRFQIRSICRHAPWYSYGGQQLPWSKVSFRNWELKCRGHLQHEEVMLLVASALSPIWECHLSKQTWTKEYVTGDIQLRLRLGLSGVLVTLKRTNHLQLGSYMNSGKTSQRVDYHIPGYQQGWGPSEDCLEDPTFS